MEMLRPDAPAPKPKKDKSDWNREDYPTAINRKELMTILNNVLIDRAKLIYYPHQSAVSAVKSGGYPIRIDDIIEAIAQYNRKYT